MHNGEKSISFWPYIRKINKITHAINNNKIYKPAMHHGTSQCQYCDRLGSNNVLKKSLLKGYFNVCTVILLRGCAYLSEGDHLHAGIIYFTPGIHLKRKGLFIFVSLYICCFSGTLLILGNHWRTYKKYYPNPLSD